MRTVLFFIFLSLSPAVFGNETAGEPTFSEVLKAAYAAERLNWGEVDSWRSKIKKAPWFPKIILGYDHTIREADTLSISDNISVAGGTVTVGPRENDFDQTVNNGNNLHVRAAWALNELVFPSESLAVRNQISDLMKSRLSFSDHLFKIYSERNELQEKKGSRTKVRLLTERLDALTGGVFDGRWE